MSKQRNQMMQQLDKNTPNIHKVELCAKDKFKVTKDKFKIYACAGVVSEIGDVTGMQCTAYVTDSTNVRILNVGANSVVHYGMQEDQPPVDDESPTPVLCIVHKPTGPIPSLRRRSRDPDPEDDCRLLFGVKRDVISNELMTLTFSENLSNGIVGTDSNDPSRRYLIDVTSISNVYSSDDHCKKPSRCQYCPLLPDPSQITLTRNVCGFWLRFFGPATTFDVTLGLRVATLRHDETFPESPEPLPSDSETIELVDEVTISIETCNGRKRRKNNQETGVRDRDGDDLKTTRWKDFWIHGSKETTDGSFELVPRTMSRTKRTGSLKTKTYGQVLSRLEMLGEEGKWEEFDYFSAQLVKTYERKDVDLYLVVVLEQAFAEYYKRNLGAAVTIAKGALKTLKKRPAENSTMLAGRTYYLLSAIYQVARKYGVAERCMEHAQQALSDFEIGEDTGNACYNKGSLYTDMIANDSCPSDRIFDEVRESLELAICHWRKDPSGCVAHQRRAHTKLASALLVCDSQQGRARTVNPRNVEAARRSIETVRKELWHGMPKRGRCRFLLTESDLYYREKGYTLSQEKAEEARNLADECGFKLEADMAKQRLTNLASCQRAILTPTTSQLLNGWEKTMGRKLLHMLVVILIMSEDLSMPEACRNGGCRPYKVCWCSTKGITTIPQNLPKSITGLYLMDKLITAVNQSELLRYRNLALPSLITIKLDENPWHCDCRMGPFRLETTKFPSIKDKITLSTSSVGTTENYVSPTEFSEVSTFATHTPVSESESANNSYNITVASRYHWHFISNAGSTAHPAGKPRKTIFTVTSPRTITPEQNPESSSSHESAFPLPVLIRSVFGSVAAIALIVAISLTVWYKRKTEHPPLDQAVGNNTNTIMSSGQDQTAQGQSQANTKIITNTTASEMIQDDVNQYEDIDNHHVQTTQGQSQAVTEINTNPASVTSGHDDQNKEEMKQNDLTGQHQSYTITESLDSENLSYGTAADTSQLNSLYEIRHDQTGQGQYQVIPKSLDVEDTHNGTVPTASQLPSLSENVETQ
ncbi:corticospinal neuron axon guidance through spinal cord [Branchiostoma belcheri]|nr:corticospinal neuron axon guidance through spinal cord [Branchiostoma belcheri]